MNKEPLQWSLMGLLLVGLVWVGVLVTGQGAQIRDVARSLSEKSTQEQQVLSADAYTVITQKTIVWNGRAYQFMHRCEGAVQVADRQVVPFCIGKNQLVVTEASSRIKILERENSTRPADAPVLLDAYLVPGSQKGAVLLSYAKDECITTNDCGVGMSTNLVRGMYQLTDGNFRALSNYPEFGRAVWNAAGTKAIFVPSTCGGAGCDVAPLMGYTLGADLATEVTTVKAAGTEDERAQDASGKKLSRWGSIAWVDGSRFTATVLLEDGSMQRVNGEL